MKKLLLAIAFIFITATCFAVGPEIFMTPGAVTGGGTCTGVSPTGCIFYESFDGSTPCWSGGNANCLNGTWTNLYTGAVTNYATAPAPLQGTYSLGLPATAGRIQAPFTATNGAYVGMMVNFPSYQDYDDMIKITDASYNNLCTVEFPVSTTHFLLTNTGGDETATSSGLTAGTYYIIIQATKGTGNNAVCSLSYSTTGSAGSWTTISNSNGTWTATPAGIELHSPGVSGTAIYDNIRVSSATFNFN